MIRQQLTDLLSQYPLGPEWSVPELFSDRAAIGELGVNLVGLSCRRSTGEMATGSAADVSEMPLARAFFELIERTAIIDAEKSAGHFLLESLTRFERRKTTATALFPLSTDPEKWRYSKSNGVAAQRDWATACRAATLEVIERDRILRSWMGGRKPHAVALPTGSFLDALKPLYHIEAYVFAEKEGPFSSVHVAAIFGFPRGEGAPRVSGFGAHETLKTALAKASSEFLQGLGFLWGESLPSEIPNFSPTPDYHQELYLHSAGIQRIKNWLAGHHESYHSESYHRFAGESLYADLTPPHLKGTLWVVKACVEGTYPLAFGACPLFAPPTMPPELLVHPIT